MTTYIDYKLDIDGDRAIENGDFVMIYDADVIKQQVETNLKLSKRDFFLNLEEGIRFFDSDTQDGLFGAVKLTPELEGQIQMAVENTIGIVALNTFELNLTGNTLYATIKVLTEFGEIPITTEITF